MATSNVGTATKLVSGTTEFNIPVANGNIVGNVAGTTNLFTFASTGLFTTGLISATGNVTGNYILGNGASLTGVITSVANINSGNSNVTVTAANGNISVGVGGTANVAVFATTGEYVTGLLSASGNITSAANVTGGNLLTGGLISATANINANNVMATNIVNVASFITVVGGLF